LQTPVGFEIAPWLRTGTLENEFNHLSDALRELFATRSDSNTESAHPAKWLPAVDLYDHNDVVTVKAELPGMKKDDIDISLQEGLLTISGERKARRNVEIAGAVAASSSANRFQRTVKLPYSVDSGAVKAAYVDGLLTVELPKAEAAKPKQIKIKFNE
jgi:HSP20 family protein